MLESAGRQAPAGRLWSRTIRLFCPETGLNEPVKPAAVQAERAAATVMPTRFGTVRQTGVGVGVGAGVGAAVGVGVGAGVGAGVEVGVGVGVAPCVAVGPGVGVGAAVGAAVGVGGLGVAPGGRVGVGRAVGCGVEPGGSVWPPGLAGSVAAGGSIVWLAVAPVGATLGSVAPAEFEGAVDEPSAVTPGG